MKRSLLFLWLLFPIAAFSQSANVELSTSPLRNGEPYLAINPANSSNLVVAWMSLRLVNLSYFTITISTRASFDGGATWSAAVDLPHNGVKWQSADVSMAWRASSAMDGVLFLAYIDYLDSSNTSGGIFVVSSSNGGASWSSPVKAIDAAEDTDVSLDRPWLAVDNSTAASAGNLYICSKPAPWNPIPNHSYFTRSTDGGNSWSPESVLDSMPYSSSLIQQPMGSPAVASDGTLYIAYPFFTTLQQSGFALAISHDGGASFARSFILQPVTDLKEKDSAKLGFHLVADPTNSQHLLLAWPDARKGDLDIFTSASFNAGATWSTPVRVNDDPAGNGVVQDMLWPTFGKDGSLAIVWRDRRNGTPDGYASASETYYAVSRDGGLTWSKNLALASALAPYNKILVDPGNDFMTAALSADTLYAAWADTRTDSLRIYFGKVTLGAPSSVAISVLESIPTLSVVPNPSSDHASVNFILLSASNCSLAIYDELGALVRRIFDEEISSGVHSVDCPLAGLSSGNYFVELRTTVGTQRAKLTVGR